MTYGRGALRTCQSLGPVYRCGPVSVLDPTTLGLLALLALLVAVVAVVVVPRGGKVSARLKAFIFRAEGEKPRTEIAEITAGRDVQVRIEGGEGAASIKDITAGRDAKAHVRRSR